ncbi:MAG: hypothetical protein C5B49_05310 [Bdellovibrio sp.]|nr:MAG: hypothetical protein C5B49_05310 [Bdellovibrio sp.]
MEKFFSVSVATLATVALMLLVVVPWLVILAAPLIIILSAPIAFMSYLAYRRRRKNISVLVVDDDPISVSVLLLALQHSGIRIHIATSGQEMLHQLKFSSYDLMILDQFMPDLTGERALTVGDDDPLLRNQIHGQVPVVFYTSYASDLIYPNFQKFAVKDVWIKGLPLSEMQFRLDQLVTELVA